MLVFPGGGFRYLEIDKEGHHIAGRLAEEGITSAVVKYRTCPPSARIAGRRMPPRIWDAVLGDALRAVRLVRHRKHDYGLDEARIGALGFSAGGALVAGLSTSDATEDLLGDVVGQESARPNCTALVYSGARDEVLEKVDSRTPPAFLCGADDDRETPTEHCMRYYRACREAGVTAEMHIYRRGGHGFGLGRAGLPVASWVERLLDWLRDLGML
jgi:acetyl esterase/lipase